MTVFNKDHYLCVFTHVHIGDRGMAKRELERENLQQNS